MTYQEDCTIPKGILEAITAEGLENLTELIRILVNAVMKVEREQHLGAEAYERKETLYGYANGYKPKTVKTRMGEIEFAIPQVREGNLYTEALERNLKGVKLIISDDHSGLRITRQALFTGVPWQRCQFHL